MRSLKRILTLSPRQHYIKDCYTCFGTVYPNLAWLLLSSKEYPKMKCQEELMLRVLPIGKMQREACLLVWPTNDLGKKELVYLLY